MSSEHNCLFCKIVRGEIPCAKVYEDDDVLAFKDIKPIAPVHVLVIPKKHVADGALGIVAENSIYVAKVFEAIAKIAAGLGLNDGFRVVSNYGESAGQTVSHIHFHIISGRQLRAMA